MEEQLGKFILDLYRNGIKMDNNKLNELLEEVNQVLIHGKDKTKKEMTEELLEKYTSDVASILNDRDLIPGYSVGVHVGNTTVQVMDDIESHINGKTGISLSIVGLTDLYRDEEEYDPYDSSLVDLLVSSDIKAARNSCHYGNEFVSKKIITPNNIKSVDIRLLQYIESDRYKSIDDIISKYNSLRKIALSIIKRNLDIKFREMSDGNGDIFDIDRLSNIPKIKIKNYS